MVIVAGRGQLKPVGGLGAVDSVPELLQQGRGRFDMVRGSGRRDRAPQLGEEREQLIGEVRFERTPAPFEFSEALQRLSGDGFRRFARFAQRGEAGPDASVVGQDEDHGPGRVGQYILDVSIDRNVDQGAQFLGGCGRLSLGYLGVRQVFGRHRDNGDCLEIATLREGERLWGSGPHFEPRPAPTCRIETAAIEIDGDGQPDRSEQWELDLAVVVDRRRPPDVGAAGDFERELLACPHREREHRVEDEGYAPGGADVHGDITPTDRSGLERQRIGTHLEAGHLRIGESSHRLHGRNVLGSQPGVLPGTADVLHRHRDPLEGGHRDGPADQLTPSGRPVHLVHAVHCPGTVESAPVMPVRRLPDAKPFPSPPRRTRQTPYGFAMTAEETDPTPDTFDETAWRQRILDHRKRKDEFLAEDPDSPIPEAQRDDFDGLEYFDPDPEFRLVGRYEAVSDPAEVELGATRGPPLSYERVGTVGFDLRGDHHVLRVYRASGVEDGFVPVRDETNGDQTWEHGRYLSLDLDPSTSAERVVVDFNLAYHPFAVLSETYVSAIPPKENQLPVRVRAGERR